MGKREKRIAAEKFEEARAQSRCGVPFSAVGISKDEMKEKLKLFKALKKDRFKRSVQATMWLDPNHGQSLKLGKYSFGLSQLIEIGKEDILFMSDSPATTIRTKRICMNAPCPGFATVYSILIANVAVTVGGREDAYAYNANSFCGKRDLPTLPPSQKATMSGSYTGVRRSYLPAGTKFLFCVTFSGRSTIAGGA